MKKGIIISLLSVVFLAFISCSSDDSSSSSVPDNVTARMGGVNLVFDQINVIQFPYQDGGQNYVNLEIEAISSSDSSKILRFEIDQGLVGVNEMLVLSYESAGIKYDYSFDQDAADTATLASEVLKNSNGELKGTFSGNVTYYNPASMLYQTISISNASYSISY